MGKGLRERTCLLGPGPGCPEPPSATLLPLSHSSRMGPADRALGDLGAGRGNRLSWGLTPGLSGSSVQGSEVSRVTGQQLSLRPLRGPWAGAAAGFSAVRQALGREEAEEGLGRKIWSRPWAQLCTGQTGP